MPVKKLLAKRGPHKQEAPDDERQYDARESDVTADESEKVGDEERRSQQEDEESLVPQEKGFIYDDPTKYDKIAITGAVVGINACTALCMRILGPSLLDVAAAMNVDPALITRTLFARAAGYFAGAVMSGVVYRYLNRVFVLAICTYVAAGVLITMPFVPSPYLLGVLLVVMGLMLGIIDPATSSCVLYAWGEKSAPFMQLLFFGFGVGSLLTPQIVKPFLSPRAQEGNELMRNIQPNDGLTHALALLRDAWLAYQGTSNRFPRVIWAFFIAGGICIFFGTIQLVYFCLRPNVRFTESAPESVKLTSVTRQSVMQRWTSRTEETPPERARFSSRFLSERMSTRHSQSLAGSDGQKPKYGYKKAVMLFATCMYLFIGAGMQTGVSIMLVSIAVRYPKWQMPSRAAADLDTVVWATFTAMRAVSFGLAFFLSPAQVLSGCSCVLVGATVMMLVMPGLDLPLATSQIIFRVVMVVWSFGFAAVVPTTIVFLRNFMSISNLESSALFAALAGVDLYPSLIGLLITDDWSMGLIVRVLGSLLLITLFIFAFMLFWGYRVLGTAASRREQEKKTETEARLRASVARRAESEDPDEKAYGQGQEQV